MAVVNTLDGFLDSHPAVQLNILKSIGAKKEQATPSTKDQIESCWRLVERTLGTTPPKGHATLTEPQAHIS